jgi:hypothetical protein
MINIYTIGVMDSVKDDAPELMTGWREQVKEYFSSYDVNIFDPTRRPHSLDSTLSDREIFTLDLIDIKNSDLCIADCRLHNGRSQYGSPIEVFYCSYILGKPVIGWYNKEEGYRKNSVFQNVLISNMFPSLEEAMEHISLFYC